MGFFDFFSSLFGDTKKSEVSSQFNEFLKDLKLIKLPEEVVMLTDKVVLEECKEIYSTYKSIDYKNSNKKRYEDKEWNSWEVSYLMDMYNRKKDFKLHDISEVLNEDVLELSFDDLSSNIRSIVKKYERSVDMTRGKHFLVKQKIWTAREISLILLYLHKFNMFDN